MEQIFSAPPRWLCPKNYTNTIQYLRLTLVRNLKDYSFTGWSDRQQRSACYAALCSALKPLKAFEGGAHFTMVDLSNAEKSLLLERELIDGVLAARNEDCGVFINKSMDLLAQLNGAEHLIMHAYCVPAKIEEAFRRLDELDDLLEASLDYAYEPGLGYLGSDPKCLGEAFQISALLHLPALARSKKLLQYVQAAASLGYSIDDRYVFSAGPCGDFYLVSAKQNLGLPLEQLQQQFMALLQQLQKLEQQASKELAEGANFEQLFVKASLEELRKPALCAGEMLNIISNLRFAKKTGYDSLQLNLQELYHNMVFLLPASMKYAATLQQQGNSDYKQLRAQKMQLGILAGGHANAD